MTHRVLRIALVLAMPALPQAVSRTECPYPCWTEIVPRAFAYESFRTQPLPPVAPPYEFSLPYPSQTQGAWSPDCNAIENPAVDLYQYDPETNSWTGPLTGPVYRNPAYLEVSPLASGRKGLAARVSFAGQVNSYNGNTLIESVFFHTDRCYHASTEFGFSHYVKGLPGDDRVFFYYEANANCKPTGKCRVRGTGEYLVDRRVNLPLTIPAGPNSRGGPDWLYEAYLVNAGSDWRVRVVDPYNLQDKLGPVDYDVSNFFLDLAMGYSAHGADGYVTATSTRDGPVVYSGDPPVMNVVGIYAAK